MRNIYKAKDTHEMSNVVPLYCQFGATPEGFRAANFCRLNEISGLPNQILYSTKKPAELVDELAKHCGVSKDVMQLIIEKVDVCAWNYQPLKYGRFSGTILGIIDNEELVGIIDGYEYAIFSGTISKIYDEFVGCVAILTRSQYE